MSMTHNSTDVRATLIIPNILYHTNNNWLGFIIVALLFWIWKPQEQILEDETCYLRNAYHRGSSDPRRRYLFVAKLSIQVKHKPQRAIFLDGEQQYFEGRIVWGEGTRRCQSNSLNPHTWYRGFQIDLHAFKKEYLALSDGIEPLLIE